MDVCPPVLTNLHCDLLTTNTGLKQFSAFLTVNPARPCPLEDCVAAASSQLKFRGDYREEALEALKPLTLL